MAEARDDGGGEDLAPAEPSSTVMVLRDGDGAPEAFMLERHLRSDFAGGALVFPGGKVDDADRVLPEQLWTGLDPAAAAEEIGAADPAEALGYHVAAVRETFEEAGVLLARHRGRPVTAADLDGPPFAAARQRLIDHDASFDLAAWLEDHDVVLDLGALAFWSWWVTPKGSHRRYDTRFFVALLPESQAHALAHDDVETTSSRWATPTAALAAHERGEVTVIYPTRKNLDALAGFDSAAAAFQAAVTGRTDRRRLEPRLVIDGDEVLVQHPDGGPPEPP